MRVFITGASGYLGACMRETFRTHGHEVVSLSRRACGGNWIPYSLSDDPRLLPLNDADVLIHAAYDFTPRHWADILRVNVDPSIALFQAAAEAHVGVCVLISTMSSFDGCRSNYGKAKRMIEEEVLRLGGLIIRPGLVWGEPSGGIMAALERALAIPPIVPFPSGGAHSVQFLIHQTDLADTLVALVENPPSSPGTVLSLAHPAPLTLRSILQSIAGRNRFTRMFLPVPWRIVMAGLRAAEMLDCRLPFRSDSLVGLIHGNPKPEISAPPTGITFRPFA